MLTIILFLFIFLLEGSALLEREIIFFLYSLLPAVYFIEKTTKKEEIVLPKTLFFLYFFFLISSLISFLFSSDKINSINYWFFYLIAFFLLILSYNEKKIIQRSFLKKVFWAFALIFCFFLFLPKSLFLSTPYQLVFPFYGAHNHLGDFLGMVVIWLLYDWLKQGERISLFLLMFFFIFFIFSFSRSAFIDLLVIIVFFFLTKRLLPKKKKVIFILIIFLIIVFLFTQQEFYKIEFFNALLPFLREKLFFQPRSLFSGRIEYFLQGVKGFWEKPSFGWGLGNFVHLSSKYVSQPLQEVKGALNLPLTILAETGLFGFLFFSLFISYLFLKIDFKKQPIFLLFIYLTLNFLTDYTYSIYGMFLLWFFFGGFLLKKETRLTVSSIIYSFISFFILVFVFLKLSGQILTLSGLSYLGIKLFPFNHLTFQQAITSYFFQGELKKAKKLANEYYSLSLNSPHSLIFLSRFYRQTGEKKKALFYLEKIIENDFFSSFDILKEAYILKKEIEGKRQADLFFEKFFPRQERTFYLRRELAKEVYSFCQKENIFICRYREKQEKRERNTK